MDVEKVNLYAEAGKISSKIVISGAPNSTPSIEGGDLDEIDADETETFTLEEMKKLILSYRKRDKDFLIARVTTPNPDDQSTLYNFYYAAAEINRVLFKFESSRRLLHRMRVKNPLNNMYIVGQVFYYKITTEEIDRAIVDYYFNSEKEKKSLRRAFSAVFSKSQHITSADERKKQRARDSLDISNKEAREAADPQKAPCDIIQCVGRGEVKTPSDIPSDRRVVYTAKYFATDDDFLIKTEIRDYFRSNALEEEDDFLYEIDRTRNDFMALLDDDSEDVSEGVSDWRRVLSAHVSMAVSLLIVCLILGAGPGFIILFLPLVVFVVLSFICSLCYVLCCRQSTFDTQAVNEVEDEI
ncbi:hypothetical protein PAPHI01_0030 [Pancytospora philotis]|nr:hypothetical protein PAPHI01_0030 [Pancytospora philotis]